MSRVLVAEDEAAIREFIVINLQRNGYETVEAADGREAIEAFENAGEGFDVALIDIMMPEADGLEVCRHIRGSDENIGIIMLTAKTQEIDKVTGFLAGADDYVTKPFSTTELMARVDAVCRRAKMGTGRKGVADQAEVLHSGSFALETGSRTLLAGGKPVELTQIEYHILKLFFESGGKVLDRTDILNSVWGGEYAGQEKIVDVNIRRMRMKIEKDPSIPRHLITVWGVGYRWIP